MELNIFEINLITKFSEELQGSEVTKIGICEFHFASGAETYFIKNDINGYTFGVVGDDIVKLSESGGSNLISLVTQRLYEFEFMNKIEEEELEQRQSIINLSDKLGL